MWQLELLQLEQRAKPCSLDGCPMFAQAYMGRKRRGASPFNAIATRVKILRQGRELSHEK